MNRCKYLAAGVLAMWMAALALGQQPKQPDKAKPPEKTPAPTPRPVAPPAFAFQNGPVKGKLGDIAEIDVPAGYKFLPKGEMSKFMTMTENIPTGREMGAIMPKDWPAPKSDWFLVFEFEDTGYVKDEDKDLDADAALKMYQEGTEAGNAQRRARGWGALHVTGWDPKPFYDQETKNLTWGLRVRGDGPNSGDTINYNSRILGRRGVMSANLLVDPEDLQTTIPTYKKLLGGYQYVSGQKYSEWRTGDKVAAYGLAGLLAGGAVAVAAKSGLLGKLIKPIIVGAVVVFGAIGRFFKSIFGGGRAEA